MKKTATGQITYWKSSLAMATFTLFMASPDYAKYYTPNWLDQQDLIRVSAHPQLAANLSWQVSRALKQTVRERFPTAKFSLSHKRDHVLIAFHQGERPGVDLEWLVKRDIAKLAKKVANPIEQTFLEKSQTPVLDFYRLWSIKEALIKAENLHFPRDIKAVGMHHLSTEWQLLSVRPRHYFWVSACLDGHWVLAAVWPCSAEQLRGHIVLECYLPERSYARLEDIKTNVPNLQWIVNSLPNPSGKVGKCL